MVQETLYRAVALLQRLHRFPPTVLVTTADRNNTCHLATVLVDAVVGVEEFRTTLVSSIHGVLEEGALQKLARLFAEDNRLDPLIRRALRAACQSPRPIVSVKALVRQANVDRTTLWPLLCPPIRGTLKERR